MTQPNLTRGDELTSAQLRECPFCGDKAAIVAPAKGSGIYVECLGCYANLFRCDDPPRTSRETAIAAWNTRAPAVQPDRAAAGVTGTVVEKALDSWFGVRDWRQDKSPGGQWLYEAYMKDMRAALTAILPDVAGERDSALRQAVTEMSRAKPTAAINLFRREKQILGLLPQDSELARTSGADGEKP